MALGNYKGRPMGRPSTINSLASDPNLTPWERLAMCIVAQAAVDLRRLLRSGESSLRVGTTGEYIFKDRTLKFFRSRWCDALLVSDELTGDDIVEMIYQDLE